MGYLRRRILEQGRNQHHLPAEKVKLISAIGRTQAVFRIDNVARFFWEHEEDYWEIDKAYPNLAPPFYSFWMEYKMPTTVHVDGAIRHIGKNKGMEIGVLFQGFPIEVNPEPFGNTDCKWSLSAVMIIGDGQAKLSGGDSALDIGIRPDGTVGYYGENKAIRLIYSKERMSEVEKLGITDAEFMKFYSIYIHPMLLAISLLHCKNVETIPRDIVLPKRQRQSKEPFEKYYILKIDSMARTLRTEGKSESTGLKNALHICRGHFKDYRERGLFGKLRGIYWWDSQVRGSIETGVIKKDYEINQA